MFIKFLNLIVDVDNVMLDLGDPSRAYYAVIIGTVPICYRFDSVLFGPRFIFFFVCTYFASGFDAIYESLFLPLHISTLPPNSLVVDQVYQSCVVTFSEHETWVYLIFLDILDFNVIFLWIGYIPIILFWIFIPRLWPSQLWVCEG